MIQICKLSADLRVYNAFVVCRSATVFTLVQVTANVYVLSWPKKLQKSQISPQWLLTKIWRWDGANFIRESSLPVYQHCSSTFDVSLFQHIFFFKILLAFSAFSDRLKVIWQEMGREIGEDTWQRLSGSRVEEYKAVLRLVFLTRKHHTHFNL